ncbi:tryptophan--tRNA ligase [Paenibacillus thiaminolyticus]|uniref:tryptophan--tRNA ligase n=1 Tax=Paenibacillus thiaminolyticus TaxID=49283 RepID=UPI002350C386|nr:tryptophan--tRNA ligase [Paenibacillus thiaminolyticus]WCR25556.1 tryptophan--tRNA ligase [Paenibacillus thiaminolyticus]
MQERILTGDRVTGKLHLGHYVGSLKNRVELQHQFDTYLILADVQALTTHFEHPELLQGHLRNVALDYLAAGIDPEKATIFVQSLIPEIAELTAYFSMFVSVNSLRHNPTIKSEAKDRGYQEMYYGFLGYPVSQTADITFCKATLVPVGEDQLPVMEQTRKIVRRFNQLYRPVLPEPRALVGDVPRLVGLDGNHKMSKSLGNALPLDSTAEEVKEKMKRAKTDPARIHKNDPGHPEVCPIYSYHQAFRKEGADEIYDSCSKGQIGCAECKQKMAQSINDLLDPMRERRTDYLKHPGRIDEIMIAGTEKARLAAKETMLEVREAMRLNYFKR